MGKDVTTNVRDVPSSSISPSLKLAVSGGEAFTCLETTMNWLQLLFATAVAIEYVGGSPAQIPLQLESTSESRRGKNRD